MPCERAHGYAHTIMPILTTETLIKQYSSNWAPSAHPFFLEISSAFLSRSDSGRLDILGIIFLSFLSSIQKYEKICGFPFLGPAEIRTADLPI